MFIPPQATPFPIMFLDALDASATSDLICPAWIDASILEPGVSLADNFALPTGTDYEDMERAVVSFGPKEAPPLAPGWLRRTPASLRHGLADWVVCALKVVAARARGHASIALHATLLAKLPETWRAACRELLGDGVLFVLHANPALIGRFGERAALVGDRDGLLCWAPVDEDHLGAITDFCRDVAQQQKQKPPTVTRDHELIED